MIIILLIFFGLCIWGIVPKSKKENSERESECPRCGSTSISIQKRFELLKKVSSGGALSGGFDFLPDGNHRVCMKCGKKFKV
ncbi:MULTISPECIES: hypothetical protein [Clostridium]|uniref:Uncharacterized protein n=1 Tax=Clostridium frigoriphilum TaxID=443253 RepID=A0ABU7UW72_9CLOT|nr:hypothetical protein [Clostridium sp. DSM 17811]MBU3102182.1 hypothetical protein [Clostridium sp. DSM 17811]